MNRVMTVALLGLGLAIFAPGQSVSKTSAEKDGGGIPARAIASPAGLDFGDQVVQTISKPSTVTLTNNSGKPISITRVEMSLEHGEDFVLDDDDEDAGHCTDAAIEPGKTCNIKVAFFPLLVGQRTSLLLITYDDPANPQKITLRGNGINPTNE